MAVQSVYASNSVGTPANGDTVNFEGGGLDVSVNLDQSGLAEGLERVTIARNWRTNIGDPSTSFKADFDFSAGSKLVYNAAGGSVWYTPNGDNNLCNLIQCIGFGTLTVNGTGTVTRLEHGRGRTILGGSITVANIDLAGGDVEQLAGGATVPTTVTITGGRLDTKRGMTTLNLHGGQAVIDTAEAITTVNMTGGRLRILRSGTITNFNIYGGDLRNVEISKAITITNCTIWASVPGMSAFLANPLITFSNTPTKRIADASEWQ